MRCVVYPAFCVNAAYGAGSRFSVAAFAENAGNVA